MCAVLCRETEGERGRLAVNRPVSRQESRCATERDIKRERYVVLGRVSTRVSSIDSTKFLSLRAKLAKVSRCNDANRDDTKYITHA